MTYADTSFLFSIVLRDSNTTRVTDYLSTKATVLALTEWQKIELKNAIRLSVWRRIYTDVEAEGALRRIEFDLSKGNLVEKSLVWADVFAAAEALSSKHTPKLGIRSLGLLHVAVASSLGASRFLTCDGRQVALARAAGMAVESI